MTACEQQPQFVVTHPRHLLLERPQYIAAPHGRDLLSVAGRLPADPVQGTPTRNGGDPRAGIRRFALVRPGPQCVDEGVLNRVLRKGEIAGESRHRCYRAAVLRAKHPGDVHTASPLLVDHAA